MPEQIELLPVIVPGCVGTELTVIAKVLCELLPQLLFATTVNVPLLVGVRETEVPVPLGVPPPLYDHV